MTAVEALRRRVDGVERYLALAALIYLPLLVARPGDVGADTKQYLYLDPGGLLERARSLWDPSFGGGTVTHQTVGYLWPMGPYYWLTEAVGIPDWIAQRVWIGSIIFLAAAGALFLLDRVLPRRGLNVVGALAYGLSPYVLGHATGQSVMLLPFAALPWLVLIIGRATRDQGWAWPALYALVVTTAGSLNGSSIFFVVLGSALFAPMLARDRDDVSYRDAVLALARTGVLTLVTQLWWLVAYAVGGAHGLPILEMTETLSTTSSTTAATEVIRGLGYWFFYGRDVSGPWLDNITPLHTEWVPILAVSFVVPIAALLLGGFVRWRYRAYFAVLALVGLVIAVGAHASPEPSPYGRAFRAASGASDLVFSLRNTQRATPLLLLGLAALLTAGLHGLAAREVRWARVSGAVLVVAVIASFPSFWVTGLVGDRFHREGDPPEYVAEAADTLDEGEGRILALPGIDFGAYRWGNTLDPVLTAYVERPVIWRELIPWGTAPGVDLLGALDRSIQEGYFEPDTVAPVARLLGSHDVVVRSDLQFERYRTVRPRVFWDALRPTPDGLGDPVTFGEGVPNRAPAELPMIDELELGIDPDAEAPPALAVFPVEDAPPFVRAVPTGGGVVLAGSGEGVLSAAAAGIVDGTEAPFRYAAEITADETLLDDAISPSTHLVLTDSNRWRAHHWYSLRENVGATEPLGDPLLGDDEGDARIPPIGDQLDRSLSYAEYRGAERIWASSYGNSVTLVPESRPYMAFDGDHRTAWMSGSDLLQDDGIIGIELDEPSRADRIVLRQPIGRAGTTPIESVEILLDGEAVATVELDERSERLEGQPVALDGRAFTTLEVAVLEMGHGGPGGFASIDIPGVQVEEIIHLPTDLTETLGADMFEHPLSVVLSRHRVEPAEVVRRDPEPQMRRAIHLPGPVTTELSGTARLSDAASDSMIDLLVGIPPADAGGVTARSHERIGGDLMSRASSAFDGDLDTAWRSPFGDQEGNWVELASADTFRLDTLVLDVIADGRHSIPREVRVETTDGSESVTVQIPDVSESDEPNTTAHVEVPLGTVLDGAGLRLTFTEMDEVRTTDWYTGDDIPMPIGIAEVEVPGVELPEPAATLDASCRTDLVSLGDEPVAVSLEGTTASALERGPIELRACGTTVDLRGGEDLVRTRSGALTGIDVDRLVLEAAPGGAAAAGGATAGGGGVPELSWSRPSRSGIDVSVTPRSDEAFWLVVSESWNEGWQATADGEDLGPPLVHDAFGMGWLIDPDGTAPIAVELRWTPQRVADVALAVSGVAALGCIALVVVGRRRRPRPPSLMADAPWLPWRAPESPGWYPALAALVAGSIVVGPIHGVLLALAVGVASAVPSARPLLAALPAALVAVSAAYVVALQVRWGYEVHFAWPENFERVHKMAMTGPVLLAVLAWSQSRRRRRAAPAPAEPDATTSVTRSFARS